MTAREALLEPHARCFFATQPSQEVGSPLRRLEAEAALRAERAWFPAVGDVVGLYARGPRRGVVKKVHTTAWRVNRESAFEYDVELLQDGLWTPEERAALVACFQRADTDGSGEISIDELHSLLADLGHPEAGDRAVTEDMFRRVDIDRSGVLTLGEFVELAYVELKDVLGVATSVFKVPWRDLRPPQIAFRTTRNYLDVPVDPFRAQVHREANHRRRLRSDKRHQRLERMAAAPSRRTRGKRLEPPPLEQQQLIGIRTGTHGLARRKAVALEASDALLTANLRHRRKLELQRARDEENAKALLGTPTAGSRAPPGGKLLPVADSRRRSLGTPGKSEIEEER